MDIKKLSILGEAAKYDICSSSASTGHKISKAAVGNTLPSGICHSFTPDGRCVSLLKVLMTNECEKDCSYCPNMAQRDVPRTAFAPEELSRLFIDMYERNYVEGLFLSSGVRHGMAASIENMIKTVEILRLRYRFGGYIHLKMLPGVSEQYIHQAAHLADRISLNLEAPNSDRLKLLSSKNFERDLLFPIEKIARVVEQNPGTTHTTQFIVGAARESDKEILTTVNDLYSSYNLKRAYFSAFNPVSGTPLENIAPAPRVRENRLYQSDFLMRFYDFKFKDFFFDGTGNLDLELDPKLMYAVRNPQLFPVEINRASYEQLLRVPGIGPKSARKILQVRRQYRIRTPLELKNMGISLKRSQKFITISGKCYDSSRWLMDPPKYKYEQLNMFKEMSL
ncbi:MAG TPA: putative DNA modification/repair radical SAM protein [Clostridia bacterium]|nr:putative DNA modification/repair radical SAM protein [Clostridia bacterium]